MTKETFKKAYLESVTQYCAAPLAECSAEQKYKALVRLVTRKTSAVRAETVRRRNESGQKRVYYFSMEFLIGRLLKNYLINLGWDETVEEGLRELGVDLDELCECERDPGLGNGGLGRLAACFMDSMASLDIPCTGIGIRYRFGLFRQRIRDGRQTEEPDDWLENGYPWETPHPDDSVVVPFGGHVERVEENGQVRFVHRDWTGILAVPYDVPLLGYGGETVNRLRLWRARPLKQELDLDAFNRGEYSLAQKSDNDANAISYLLYPDDVTPEGKRLRLQQEYFFVCAGIAHIIRRFKKAHGNNWDLLPEKVAIHTNDTHPALCVPELMRVLMDEEGLDWDRAWDLACRTISFTNHTVLPEALEKWPITLVQSLLPRIYLIIEETHRRYREGFDRSIPNWFERYKATAILWDDQVRMANLSVIGGHSVNGVAALHTEILKETVLKDFYALTPEKFNNKTNGVAHRRFLLEANRELSDLITSRIGEGWIRDAEELKKLLAFQDDEAFLDALLSVKRQKKQQLCDYIAQRFGIVCDPDSVFDIHVKRIHAYKRQLLSAFKVLALYDRLKDDPNADVPASTFIFAGKAAHSYAFAKEVIRFVCAVADMVNSDPVVNKKLKVIFMENFGVSMAQKIYPAADISEQISTAGKEASGTGCMKFIFNGAVTLGTLDGANVEIGQQVGEDNVHIFGLTAPEALAYETVGGYVAADEVEKDPVLKRVMAHLTDGSLGGKKFWSIEAELLAQNDEYFVLKDFASYLKAWEGLASKVGSREFAREMLCNIANAGIFSSDRTVRQYAEEIWKV
ncbi:MAG: glycogen/starch/alpha-glucan phosphorylase [Oscillospiraceae bacterium]|nr:glycogen/starch/alpha-glucan phosphorylase [Oscillospiraceae bacterium]